MVRIASTSLAVIGALLAPSVSAWGIAFYSGENCNQDERFCLEVGEPGENCEWYTHEGTQVAECTAPTKWTNSFYWSIGSICGVGFEDNHDCYFNDFDWHGQQCLKVTDRPDWAFHGQTLTFQCRDREEDGLQDVVPYIPMGALNITVP
ncbi:uncharacterized protein MYCFIDRAFT_198863 [Pseudocercospora fijiensis CIRAD86]|uniref:Uncharacterized protein n=1 Tax=Pseudocercospora fijiensis (strain CIRAD86) TaxID=383855 RepID=M3APB5_PSEFD|nr:uncharacterized protein MYCFIDRAFT_198863 [Pseudocercospora fijiensis CIRAD86]EME78968.1 hypothetical protein MYCFIDRAFT_198863 [Pseudocercospora fijiensis CIRAD86]